MGLFIVTATFHGALAVTAFLRMRLRQAPPAEARAPFQPVPLGRHSTPETFALDPRADEPKAAPPAAAGADGA